MVNNNTAGSGSNARTYWILIIGIIALAFSAPWVKQSNFEPATSVILRCSIGLIALLPFYFSEIKKLGRLNKTGIILSLVAGLFLGIDFTAWNYSIYYVGSGIASILLNLQIIILPAMAAMFDRERIPKSFFIIAPIMILGVLMTGGIFDGGETVENAPRILGMSLAVIGTIAGSISGVCYGIYLYTSRKATRVNVGQIVQPMAIATAAQLIAPIFLLIFTGRGLNLTTGVLEDVGGELVLATSSTGSIELFESFGAAITPMNWFWMVVLGILGQAMAWTFVQYGSVRLDPTIVAGLLLLSPVSTVAVISVVLFGEIPTFVQILGVLLVLGAVAVQNNLHQALFGRFKGDNLRA